MLNATVSTIRNPFFKYVKRHNLFDRSAGKRLIDSKMVDRYLSERDMQAKALVKKMTINGLNADYE